MRRLLTNNKTTGIDPTRTKVLRATFEGQMFKRLNALKGDIRTSLVKNDALALKTNAPLPPKAFAFRTLDEKHTLFMEWLREQQRQGILEIVETPGIIREGVPWTDTFISSAYQKGILRARQELRKQGVSTPAFTGQIDSPFGGISAAFNQPIHIERSQLIFSRTFSELEGITAQMDAAISRTLAQGMIDGKSPLTIASDLNKQVDIGIMRSKRMARTEVIRAHHQANIAEYRVAQVEGVEIVAEFLTAGDSRVCIRCATLAGKRFTLDQAENLIPVHPNCRCVAIPIVDDNIKTQKPFQNPTEIKRIAGL